MQIKFSSDKLRAILKKYAESRGFQLNPHEATLSRELNRMMENFREYGYFYCPCREADITGDIFRDKKIECPCVYHFREIAKRGYCKCEVFVAKKDKAVPSFISTCIHGIVDIQEEFSDQGKYGKYELFLSKPGGKGWAGGNRGEVKIYVPDRFNILEVRVNGEPFVAVDKIDVLPHGLSQAVFEQLEREIEAKEYSFNDGVLFMMLEFEDVCKIEVYTSRK